MCELAERYRAQALAARCAMFIVTEVAEVDWVAVEKAPMVATAMARLAVSRAGRFKKFEDFGSKEEYGAYVKRVLRVGMRVRWRRKSNRHLRQGEEGTVVEDKRGSWRRRS